MYKWEKKPGVWHGDVRGSETVTLDSIISLIRTTNPWSICYTIRHVPSKTLHKFGTLSCASVSNGIRTSNVANSLMEAINIYVDSIISNLPTCTACHTELREQLKVDSICSEVMIMCQSGWPEHSTLNAVLRQYWWERSVLTVHTQSQHTCDILNNAKQCSGESAWWESGNGEV